MLSGCWRSLQASVIGFAYRGVGGEAESSILSRNHERLEKMFRVSDDSTWWKTGRPAQIIDNKTFTRANNVDEWLQASGKPGDSIHDTEKEVRSWSRVKRASGKRMLRSHFRNRLHVPCYRLSRREWTLRIAPESDTPQGSGLRTCDAVSSAMVVRLSSLRNKRQKVRHWHLFTPGITDAETGVLDFSFE